MSGSALELLARLGATEAEEVLALGSRLHLASGRTLFELGEQADSLYVVERGRILLTLPMKIRTDERNVVVEERVPGQTVGWSALIPPHRFTLTATAPLDTELVAFDRATLVRHFAASPDVGYIVTSNLARLIGQRLQVLQAMWLREMQRVVALSHT